MNVEDVYGSLYMFKFQALYLLMNVEDVYGSLYIYALYPLMNVEDVYGSLYIFNFQALYPLMNVEDVYGSLYSPGDGTIDPHGLCTALARYATREGAKVIQIDRSLGQIDE